MRFEINVIVSHNPEAKFNVYGKKTICSGKMCRINVFLLFVPLIPTGLC